jgi:hypothetical protein
MSKAKPKKKAKKAAPRKLRPAPESKSQFNECITAALSGKAAYNMLKFYSPIHGDHVATATMTSDEDGRFGVSTVEGYALTIETLEELVKWAKELNAPARITF